MMQVVMAAVCVMCAHCVPAAAAVGVYLSCAIYAAYPFLHHPIMVLKILGFSCECQPDQIGAGMQLKSILATAHRWDFNVFELNEASEGHPLSALAFWLMEQTELVAWGSFNPIKLRRFFMEVEARYNDNPYHNGIHAAGVLQVKRKGVHEVVVLWALRLWWIPGAREHPLKANRCVQSQRLSSSSVEALGPSQLSLPLDHASAGNMVNLMRQVAVPCRSPTP